MIELDTNKNRPDLAPNSNLDGESLGGIPGQKRATVVQYLQQAEAELVQDYNIKLGIQVYLAQNEGILTRYSSVQCEAALSHFSSSYPGLELQREENKASFTGLFKEAVAEYSQVKSMILDTLKEEGYSDKELKRLRETS
ncbi:MAG: hypothetical protein KME07_09210 [Pegethrix bostrychoides GSE-TBD4-15B]|jgi:hypothetical protein|uniref:Uncharacterized protein n=1 Tax=Pegethrix bostrychoides GSE-TBD4-15B TaxID=2839662 RepID=A0A951PAE0_9CYAN|nr:hypothetical protein [Pegethrix bostrychoides GSE-TBD4-15B]